MVGAQESVMAAERLADTDVGRALVDFLRASLGAPGLVRSAGSYTGSPNHCQPSDS